MPNLIAQDADARALAHPESLRARLYLDEDSRCCAATTTAPELMARESTYRRAAGKLRRLLAAHYGRPVQLELEYHLPGPLHARLTSLRQARAEWAQLGGHLKRQTVEIATALFEHRLPSVSVAQLLELTTAQLTALIAGDLGSPPRKRLGRPRRVPATMRVRADTDHHSQRLF